MKLVRYNENAKRRTRSSEAVKVVAITGAVIAVAIGRRLLGGPTPGNQGEPKAKREGEASPQRGGAALVAVFIAFVPLAFSEDVLWAAFEPTGRERPWWMLLAADTLLLALIGYLAWRLRRLRGIGGLLA